MFERLIMNKVEHSTLNLQRRMRPEISKIMNFIYPTLENHQTVNSHPNIKGMSTNVYFLNHTHPEGSNEMMSSKYNVKEAELIVRYAIYLLQNKYESHQITILTLYSGQLLKIKDLIKGQEHQKEKLARIRIINVDNYQGEENDIIILSLVRSNPENKIGFLKISNRICVALSRARWGLYIFGNSKCLLGSKIKLWEDVINHLKENQEFGDSLKLACKNHDVIAEVKTVHDFSKVPEGGCNKQCDTRMECGHKCEKICHPITKT